jgi:hypothetical protein
MGRRGDSGKGYGVHGWLGEGVSPLRRWRVYELEGFNV